MLKVLFLSLSILIQATHVSFMSIECFPEKGILKVFLKQSQPDFVYDYRYTIDDDKNIDLAAKIDTNEIFVGRYIATRVQISADETKLKGKITKLDWDNSGFVVELTYPFNNKKAKGFKVTNLILNGIREDPSNLVIFKYHKFEEGVKFTLDKKEHVFNVIKDKRQK